MKNVAAFCSLLLAVAAAGCSSGGGGGATAPVARPAATALPSTAAAFAVPPSLALAVPPAPPNFTPVLPKDTTVLRRTSATATRAAFFTGEAALANGVYYLTLPNGNVFGYYAYLPDNSFIFHFDLGYEYVFDAADGRGGVYLYDFASSHWWYTGRQYPFPYIYDFALNAFLYYYPDSANAGRYTTNPRYFYNFTASKIIQLPQPTPPVLTQSTIQAGSSAQTATLATIASGYAATFTLPATTSGTSPVSVQLGNTAGALPAFTAQTPLAYILAAATSQISFAATPSFSFTLPATPTAGTNYALAIYDPTQAASGWQQSYLGPAAPSGTTVTFASKASSAVITNTSAYGFALYATTAPVATPTPSPSPSPSTTPSSGTAPVAGYLPSTAGTFSGTLGTLVTGGLLVVPSTTAVAGKSGTTVATGSFTAGVAGGAGSAVRRAASLHEFPEPLGLPERPVMDHRAFAALRSELRAATPGGRSPASVRRTKALPNTVGSQNAFYVQNGAIGSSGSAYGPPVTYTLVKVTANGYIWLDNALISANYFTSSDYDTIGQIYESTYASNVANYGSNVFDATAAGAQRSYGACDTSGAQTGSNAPDILVPPDNKINVLVTNSASLGTGVGGYFDAANYTPQSVWNCLTSTKVKSNEAPLFLVGVTTGSNASPKNYVLQEDLVRGMAHEFQHLLNFVAHYVRVKAPDSSTQVPVEEAWIDEGFSMLAQDLAVPAYPGIGATLTNDVADAISRAAKPLAAPQNYSLTAFTGLNSSGAQQYNCSSCYGLEFLFQRYLYDRFGGVSYLKKMYASGAVGAAELQAVTGVDAPTLISDFYIALAASGTGTTTDPRFVFKGFNPYGTYKSQFVGIFTNQTITLNGPVPLGTLGAASSYSALAGSAVYLQLPLTASGKAVTVTDTSFGARAGVVQR